MIELIDAQSDSLTVTWPVVAGSKCYVLELCENASASGSDRIWEELSSTLSQPQAKKKNLKPNHAYFFKVTPIGHNSVRGSWTSHTTAFRTLPAGAVAMEAPDVSLSGNQALKITWYPNNMYTQKHEAEAPHGYELQMRENRGGATWTTIAAGLQGTEVRKKNLTFRAGYQFRVRPAKSASPFSPPSNAKVASGLSQALQRWFPNTETLLKDNGVGGTKTVPLAEALGGKEFVLLYISAHWCGPCRQFTKKLAGWYRGGRFAAEVVFVSADHDENEFQNYFKTSHSSWYALDYEDPYRETLMAQVQVQGIPRLVVLDAKSGTIIEQNAVGKPLVINRWREALEGGKPRNDDDDDDDDDAKGGKKKTKGKKSKKGKKFGPGAYYHGGGATGLDFAGTGCTPGAW